MRGAPRTVRVCMCLVCVYPALYVTRATGVYVCIRVYPALELLPLVKYIQE